MICKSHQKPVAKIKLEVNGEPIKLNSFTQNIISQTVIGMVRSLRGVDAVKKVSLSIETLSRTKRASG